MTKGIQVDNQIIRVDPLILFMHLTELVEQSKNTVNCYAYELAPYPTYLLQGNFMLHTMVRKIRKREESKDQEEDTSTNWDENKNRIEPTDVENEKEIAGNGDKLMKRSQRNMTWLSAEVQFYSFWFGKAFGDTIRAYRFYLKTSFAVCRVGFDWYEKCSTKDVERTRRVQKQQRIANVIVKEEVTVHHTREKFLCNTRNKAQLIQLLSRYLKEDGHTVIN